MPINIDLLSEATFGTTHGAKVSRGVSTEKQSFFEARAAAAQIVRDEGIAAREAVREHPELAGTYLNLRPAELASRPLRDPQDRRRFVSQVRSALADDSERGEALQPVRLRERTKDAKDRMPLSRE